MNFQSQGEDSNEDLAEINMIPLIDVMLVLLIIFMVAAPFSIGGIKINLPGSKAKAGSVDNKRVILSINEAGGFYLEKNKIPAAQLKQRLSVLFENRQEKVLYIRADKNVTYSYVVDAMSAAKLAGVRKMSMLTKPTK